MWYILYIYIYTIYIKTKNKNNYIYNYINIEDISIYIFSSYIGLFAQIGFFQIKTEKKTSLFGKNIVVCAKRFSPF